MKNFTIAILMTLAASTVFAETSQGTSLRVASLDGRKYCREVISEGFFGQPKGVRHHCVVFQAGRAIDNANTFFGNPPSSFAYELRGNVIVNIDESKDSEYALSGGNLVVPETGAVLKLTK